MKPTEFLTLLWGATPRGFMHLWRLRDHSSIWLDHPGAADYYADGRADVYTGVALSLRDRGKAKRLKADEAAAIAGLWLDIDVAGGPGGHNTGAPGKAEAQRVAAALLGPTLVVDSGWGIHAWHLLDEPWRFADVSEQAEAAGLAAGWYEAHRRVAAEAGWPLDTSTRDLARLMRLPGTLNGKDGRNVPVSVVTSDGPRYERSELAALTPALGVDVNRSDADVPVAVLASLDGQAPPADKLHALLVNSPEFAASFHGLRPEFNGNRSSYDMSLALIAIQAGWSDDEIALLVGMCRGWDEKATRTGTFEGVRYEREYLVRTITTARRKSAP